MEDKWRKWKYQIKKSPVPGVSKENQPTKENPMEVMGYAVHSDELYQWSAHHAFTNSLSSDRNAH